MDGVLYLIWVSIPITLLLLAVLLKARQNLFPREEEDPNRPRRLLRLANVFALYAVACVCIDQFVFDPLFTTPKSPWPLSPPQLAGGRLLLLPMVSAFGALIFLVGRTLSPRAGFDKLRVDVRGSSPLYLLGAFAILAVMIWERGQRQGATFDFSGTPPAQMEEGGTKGKLTAQQRSANLQKAAESFWDRISTNYHAFIDELSAIAGIQTTSAPITTTKPAVVLPPGERPDYNAEGAASFGPIIVEVAGQEGVDPLFVKAVIEIASGYNQRWVSRNGNAGLLGLRPEAVKDYGDRDLFNIHQNLRIGCKELKRELDAASGKRAQALLSFRYGKPDLKELAPNLSAEAADFVSRVESVFEILSSKEVSPEPYDLRN
jgi:hypothetical protein